MVYDHVKWKPLASGVVNDGAGGNRLASVFQKGSVLRRVASAVDGELIMSDGTFDLDTIAGGGECWELVSAGVVDYVAQGVDLVMIFQSGDSLTTVRTAANAGFKAAAPIFDMNNLDD
jgi:hypothetical protein